MEIELLHNYKPSQDEDYMNPMQLEYFKRKLLSMQSLLTKQTENKISTVLDYKDRDKDIIDMASREHEIGIELETSKRSLESIKKINNALKKIDSGQYGYCEGTGEEIGIERLEIDPLALYCIEEQERQEQLSNK
ncbi:MAG: RNA polymerase-binding transcription factor DksA [Candidatus Mesenet longicola]|uniref:RNA polymerase-binding transcription factor DksA n=1 Tax=Candidatus Mesenet longicola TaxID=1892558 RepID=A0A8J3HV71_9RICK|nr:MAG: RNA polymerase-binding transcription factor DksA [Candidatus Mesenet longicola]GHM59609.1 MAG: RNA polymerase-binding transcription factor DksA [Candidatus Mesenet longicola]